MSQAIVFDAKDQIFSLHTQNTTYQMKVDSYGVLLHLYYGGRCEGKADYLLTFADRGTAGNIHEAGMHREYSYDALPQEYPVRGMSDMRSPAFVLENENGAIGCDLRYDSHEIRKGKYALLGLPAVYADEDAAETLEIVLKDAASGLLVKLLYGVLPGIDIITRSVVLENAGQTKLHLNKVLSANLDFVTGKYDLLTFYGRHGMERKLQRETVTHGAKVITSRRGTSSHQYNPMMVLCEKNTTEQSGLCYSMQFVYSGGFLGLCEKDGLDQT
ncbi:MAG: alpha-galactosidase, partial [Lachnospiraceae bacterium]|nr:alpha-galactosidase [Lachnospiraceae bacterium]